MGVAGGILFLAACDVAYNAYSANCSAPQTTELFADDREESLMHWVWVADGTALAFGVAGTAIAGNWWALLGAVLVVATMHYNYRAALRRGKGTGRPRNAS